MSGIIAVHYVLTTGQIDTDLAERGILQAELCGRRLQNEKFTHAFTSDLKRAFKVSRKQPTPTSV